MAWMSDEAVVFGTECAIFDQTVYCLNCKLCTIVPHAVHCGRPISCRSLVPLTNRDDGQRSQKGRFFYLLSKSPLLSLRPRSYAAALCRCHTYTHFTGTYENQSLEYETRTVSPSSKNLADRAPTAYLDDARAPLLPWAQRQS
jgi:hypothetical protein